MKWAIPNRGPVWLCLKQPAEKEAVAAAFAAVDSVELRRCAALIRSHLKLEALLIEAEGRDRAQRAAGVGVV